MKAKKPYYVTTPLYYVNDVPHIGHAYTTIAADVLARFHRLNGYDVFFLTGTDEHGQKIEAEAQKKNEKPIELANRVVVQYKKIWKLLHITYNGFIRTTQPTHKRVVTTLMKKVISKGDIYLGTYEDWYCIPCETFLTDTQLNDGKCPSCGREVQKLKEESFFFRMSKYTRPLLEHIEKNPQFIQPESRKNEILHFVREGLRDLSISRTTFEWGIAMPPLKEVQTQRKHVIYVWFDALINYLTGIGYLTAPKKFNHYWSHATHLIGKDILRFHAVYWPTMLMSMEISLPKTIFAHGWWTHDGEKISKSKGNAIDPEAVVREFGLDPFRYFLLREVSFGSDGDFSKKALIQRINSDLANDLGNLVSRTTKMVEKYCSGKVPKKYSPQDELDKELVSLSQSAALETRENLELILFSHALSAIWKLIRFTNQYLERKAPWKLYKEGKMRAVDVCLYHCLESLRMVALLIFPFMPDSAEKIWKGLGLSSKIQKQLLDSQTQWGLLKTGARIKMGAPLFPRIEVMPQ